MQDDAGRMSKEVYNAVRVCGVSGVLTSRMQNMCVGYTLIMTDTKNGAG